MCCRGSSSATFNPTRAPLTAVIAPPAVPPYTTKSYEFWHHAAAAKSKRNRARAAIMQTTVSGLLRSGGQTPRDHREVPGHDQREPVVQEHHHARPLESQRRGH